MPPMEVAIITLLPNTEEDNYKQLLTEEDKDHDKPEANKDNKMHLPTKEDTELCLPQEDARQIQPKTVPTTSVLPPKVAPAKFLPIDANTHHHQPQLLEDSVAIGLPRRQLVTQLDLCVSALYSVLPRSYYACAVEKLFPARLTGTINTRIPAMSEVSPRSSSYATA